MAAYRCLLWGTILVISSLVVRASIASAETQERNLILNSNGSQSFGSLIQQAQDLAKKSIEQEFQENSELTEVSIMILGEHQGQIVPLLRSKVSRSQWQKDSRIHRWTKYFASSSRVLLGFYNPSSTEQVAPSPARIRREDDPGFRDD